MMALVLERGMVISGGFRISRECMKMKEIKTRVWRTAILFSDHNETEPPRPRYFDINEKSVNFL